MSGLMLKLKPHEQVLINGVLIENGPRKAHLRIKSEGAHILRLSAAIDPQAATTPVKRAHYKAQCAVAGELASDAALAEMRAIAKDADGDSAPKLQEIVAQCARDGDFYRAMRLLSELGRTDHSQADHSQTERAQAKHG